MKFSRKSFSYLTSLLLIGFAFTRAAEARRNDLSSDIKLNQKSLTQSNLTCEEVHEMHLENRRLLCNQISLKYYDLENVKQTAGLAKLQQNKLDKEISGISDLARRGNCPSAFVVGEFLLLGIEGINMRLTDAQRPGRREVAIQQLQMDMMDFCTNPNFVSMLEQPLSKAEAQRRRYIERGAKQEFLGIQHDGVQ